VSNLIFIGEQNSRIDEDDGNEESELSCVLVCLLWGVSCLTEFGVDNTKLVHPH
jgi:hypothetical protein